MKKNALIILLTASTLIFSAASVNAQVGQFRRELRQDFRQTEGTPNPSVTITPERERQELRNEIREGNKEGSGEGGIINRIKNFIKKNLRFGARIEGKITALGNNSSSLTVVANDGKTYQVNISSSTRIVRRFGGPSNFGEFAVGDKVNVFGNFTDNTDSAINANLIRNLSIQKRWGVFFGKVTSKNSDNFVIQSVARGSLTVYVSGARLIERNETVMTYDGINVGDFVRVKGVWDSTNNTITKVGEVKDFSLPLKPTEAVTPTPTP